MIEIEEKNGNLDAQNKQSCKNSNSSVFNLQQQQHLIKQKSFDNYLLVKKKKRSNQYSRLITKKAKLMFQLLSTNTNGVSSNCCNHTSSNNLSNSDTQHNHNYISSSVASTMTSNSNLNIENNGNSNHSNLNLKNKSCNIVTNGLHHGINHCDDVKTLYNNQGPKTNIILFNRKTGLPLNSSPIPQRKASSFSFEHLVKSTNAIKRAVLNKEPETDENFNLVVQKTANISLVTNSLLGSFEESILNGRLEPVSTIFHGFRAEIGTSGSIYGNFFCPDHLKMPVIVYFYNIHQLGNVYASPYLAKVNLGKKGYLVPRKGNVQVALFNPENNIVKMFVVHYDLSEMPPNSQSFVRQKTFYMPKQWDSNAAGSKISSNSFIINNIQENNNCPKDNQGTNLDNNQVITIQKEDTTSMSMNHSCKLKPKSSWLRYLVHLRFLSSKSGKIYLHRDIRMLIFRKNEYDPGNLIGQTPTFYWKTFTEQPNNPRFSPR